MIPVLVRDRLVDAVDAFCEGIAFSPDQTARVFAAAKAAGEFGYGPQTDEDNFLVRLARQNGGQHQYVDVSQLPSPRRAAAR